MLIPIEWLKKFVKTDKGDEEIADILTLSGTNIDAVENGVIDAEITANRPDCLSIYGIAREYAAISKETLIPLEIPDIKSKNQELVKIRIENNKICPRYSAFVIQDLKIGPSPEWMVKSLELAGMRSINNIVDITNYIMIETGQPLHAFDLEKIANREMIVRQAQKGEKVTTLDGVERSIDEDAILIENQGKNIDLAGIMGGQLSEVSIDTKNILLQAAIFNPVMIRRTSKKTKISTEASYRYERGVDIESTLDYLKMAAQLFKDLANGKVVQEIDIYPEKLTEFKIKWSKSQAEKLLGVKIDPKEVIGNLSQLKIDTTQQINNDLFESAPPSFRMDLCLPQDIYEEIIRFYPVNKLPRTILPPIKSNSDKSSYNFKECIKDILLNLGFTEIYGYSFLSKKELILTNLNPENCVKISNPLSEEHEFLRPSLLTDMLTAVYRNPSFDPVAIFEIGNVFTKDCESSKLGILIAGRGSEHLESVIKSLLEKIKVNVNFEIVEVKKEILDKFKIRKSSMRFVEFDISELKTSSQLDNFDYQILPMDQKYETIAKFPSVTRDIAIIVNKNISPEEILKEIKKTDNLVKSVELFDKYESDKFGVGNKSLAYHIFYQSDVKTLNDSEITALHSKILRNLETQFNAKLR